MLTTISASADSITSPTALQVPDRASLVGARILLVDDNQHTTAMLRRALQDKFGLIEIENNPLCAVARVKAAAAEGSPYAAIVLDLQMPDMTGFEVLQQLGDALPAVVVHTGSILAPAVTQLCSARDAQSPEATALFVSHKGAGFADVLRKLELALEQPPPALADTRRFVEAFKPRLVPRHFSELAVHAFAEELTNFVNRVAQMIASLGDDHSYPVGLRNERMLALQHLRATHYTSLRGETPQGTMTNLHTALYYVDVLSPPRAAGSNQALATWADLHQTYRQLLGAIYQDFERYHCPDFALADLLCAGPTKIAETIYSRNGGEAELPRLDDPQRLLRNFLTKLATWCAEHQCREPDSSFSAVLSFLSPEDTPRENECRAQKLSGQKFAARYMLTLSDSIVRPWEKDFAALLPELVQIQKAGLAQFSFAESDTERRYFWLYLNAPGVPASTPSEKPSASASNVASPVSLVPTKHNLAASGQIEVVGPLPADLPNFSNPIVYRRGDRVLFAAGESHFQAALRLSDYLGGSEGDEATQIYRVAFRLRLTPRGIFHEESDASRGTWLAEVLVALGVEREKITFDRTRFVDRPV